MRMDYDVDVKGSKRARVKEREARVKEGEAHVKEGEARVQTYRLHIRCGDADIPP